jgi:glycosyltransferase involved in cell wall biosynthesis
VVVYNAHNHPYHEKNWNSVDIRCCYDPTHQLGLIGRFLYAYNCIKDLRKTKFDIILQLAHTSSSMWGWFLPHHAVVTTHISKPVYTSSIAAVFYNPLLRFAERLAVRYSNFLITDSVEMQEYLSHKYGKESSLIPYGTRVFEQQDPGLLAEFKVEMNQYDLLVSKITPENNIETILDGVIKANTDRSFLIVGNTDNDYGTYLIAKFEHFKNIIFCGDIDNRNKLNNLRYYANLYLDGCTANGNNAALLDAMASNSLICSNDNQFNRGILGNDALYFLTAADVAGHLTTASKSEAYYEQLIANNKQKVIHFYSCKTMIKAYTDHFEAIVPRRVRVYQPRVSRPKVSLLLKNS